MYQIGFASSIVYFPSWNKILFNLIPIVSSTIGAWSNPTRILMFNGFPFVNGFFDFKKVAFSSIESVSTSLYPSSSKYGLFSGLRENVPFFVCFVASLRIVFTSKTFVAICSSDKFLNGFIFSLVYEPFKILYNSVAL